MSRRWATALLLGVVVALAAPAAAQEAVTAAEAGGPAPVATPAPVAAQQPALTLRLEGADAGTWGPILNVVLMMTVLALAPALLVSVTSFTRIIISLHFLRQAIGTQTAPSNQVLVGLALFLTFFTMQPVGEAIYAGAVGPLVNGEIDGPAALERGWPHLRDFMLPRCRTGDFELFQELAELPPVDEPEAVTARVLVPAYLISEIKTAFQIGILLYVPFLMLDLLVASVLLALGMLQLPPIVISTPLKLILFVVVDGWDLLIGSLVRSITG